MLPKSGPLAMTSRSFSPMLVRSKPSRLAGKDDITDPEVESVHIMTSLKLLGSRILEPCFEILWKIQLTSVRASSI